MKSKIRLALVRHGETVGNSSVRYYGRTDLSLSDLGRAQIRAASVTLAGLLGPQRFSRVFASPLIRARESAHIIVGDAAAVTEIEEFREVDFGAFEGLTVGEIEARLPREFARWNRDRLGDNYTYPDGESRAAFHARVERGLERILPTLSTGLSLLVAHRGVLRAITRRLAGVEPVIELGSIQLLVCEGAGRWAAERLDVTADLAETD